MISINNLYKKYNEKIIFENLNLKFSENGLYRIAGNNGIGKSTLLKMISGMERPDKGTVIWDDQNFYKKAGYIFDYHLYVEELSFVDNLTFISKIQNLDDIYTKERINYLSKIFDLSLDSTPVRKFSSGMKKKVEIAMSILNEPKYLLWDEPFTNLDKETIQIINKEILSKDIFVIIITHNEEYIEHNFIDINI